MDENPYKAPAEDEAASLNATTRRPLTTPLGCLLAIATGFVVGFLLLWTIGFLRS